MSKQKLTPWFPGDITPFRVGVYERLYPDHSFGYAYWDGRLWGCGGSTPALAQQYRNSKSVWQDLIWQGLAKEPKV